MAASVAAAEESWAAAEESWAAAEESRAAAEQLPNCLAAIFLVQVSPGPTWLNSLYQ